MFQVTTRQIEYCPRINAASVVELGWLYCVSKIIEEVYYGVLLFVYVSE